MFAARRAMFPTIAAVLTFLIVFAGTADAAVTVSATTKKAFDKTVEAADGELKSKLTKQYNEFVSLQERERQSDARNKSLHYKNQEAESAIRKQMYEIDAKKIAQLEDQLKRTRDKHQPLFDAYKSINQQKSIASTLGSKELVSALKLQADAMKVPLQLARDDIKAKDELLKAAKKARTDKIAKIRKILSEIDSIETKMKAEKSAESTYKKKVSGEWSYFMLHAKNNDQKAVSASLGILVSFSAKIVEQKQKQYDLEQKISDIVAKAKGQMAA
ncbi:hypothetical protein [Paenibacillus thermotolerans]|uniref:hypothetical protein n=1 Tax=Paenibacillus thermotolerans TaxID=3027807 RepID=UPI002367EECB|nr:MULTISPECIES: hypothetical protein [unclassified Paenibacillus]